ncbi:WXG100 family type VII secretion target [Actinomadura violacea]|uniref:WXG100 family type VII secretion target n=1 Tax=Actinomadura violacea TaxID=2819934 RepID=A0ABS3RRQ9_9ACTN|nr:WXG100 family type VII secretion target [Actinomadura violacea]MBO2459403.1 WXG100 family type VII secretion target [Actinomadura violacea]
MSAPRPRPRPGRRGGNGDSGSGSGGAIPGLGQPQEGPTVPSILIDVASSVMLGTEVLKAYKDLQKIKPDPAAVRRAAESWYRASGHYRDSIDPMKTSYIQLGGYWSGRAFTAYQQYMDSIAISAADNNAKVLQAVGDALVNLHNQVVDQYNDGMKDFMDTLDKAIAYHKDLETQKGDANSAAWSALHSILALWIKNVNTRKRNVTYICNKDAGLMESLHGQILQLHAPRKMPSIASDKGKWVYG